ncbi:MAG: TIGR02147 family protein [Proteobacteria bacterium]|nr:MAG: TIGR02147 family protein [Pseudomonadota bacterium]
MHCISAIFRPGPISATDLGGLEKTAVIIAAYFPSNRSASVQANREGVRVEAEMIEKLRLSPLASSDGADYLNYLFRSLREANPRVSLRSWAMRLQIDDSGLLSRILSKKRKISESLARKVIELYLTDPTEIAYFEVLAIFSGPPATPVPDILRDVLRTHAEEISRLKRNQLFAGTEDTLNLLNRITPSIIAGLALKDVQHDWKKLLAKFNPTDRGVAQGYFEALQKSGIVKMSGQKVLVLKKRMKAPDSTPTESIRSFHRAMILKGLDSLANTPVPERHVMGTTISISAAKLESFQKKIEALHAEFLSASEVDSADAIYHLNTMFFPILRGSPHD